jgi:hypothetical protein
MVCRGADDLHVCLVRTCCVYVKSVNNVPVVYPAGCMPVRSESRRSIAEAVLVVRALYDLLETGSAASTLSNDTIPNDKEGKADFCAYMKFLYP